MEIKCGDSALGQNSSWVHIALFFFNLYITGGGPDENKTGLKCI